MRERAMVFGPANLVGIVTQPDPGKALPGAPAFVILNSGILHRVGASRLYVQLARALAEEGFTALRFDFSGVGDSEVRKDAIPVEERFVTETREAMDYLAEVAGVDRFVVGGLCSGADGAFFTSLEDERVVGLWQIDAFCYRTPRYYRRRYLPKIADPRAWAHSIKVRVAPEEVEERDEEQFVKPEYRRVFPPREVVGEGLGRLLARDVQLYFFFTGGLEDYNYADQHADTFPELDLGRKAELRFEPAATHMVTDLDHQAAFIDDMRAWSKQFGAAAREPVAV
ncbi:alpha/beta hydrolase family protein [Gaopeijia maritima]|uniref:Serine aminopeptidase S33 domain-containing protein n=1 Tax=Gaopeijia maritima TaxID=3119007 RepID=A0ABU9ECF4_9BACT